MCKDPFLKGRSFTRKETRYVLDIFLSAIEREVCTKGEVKIPGFGTFYKKMYPGRFIQNCNMKKRAWVPPFFSVCFSSGARIKLRLGAKISGYQKSEEMKRMREELGIVVKIGRRPKVRLVEAPIIDSKKPIPVPGIKVDE